MKLKVGDVIEIKKGHKVYAYVPEHFVYTNKKGSFKLVRSDITINDNFDYLAGRYVVINTKMDGGGSTMGGYSEYPDGYHVFCERLTDKIKVDFYQSGCFTAMIVDIEPVGKAEHKNWVEIT
jgi:hypothetical protein